MAAPLCAGQDTIDDQNTNQNEPLTLQYKETASISNRFQDQSVAAATPLSTSDVDMVSMDSSIYEQVEQTSDSGKAIKNCYGVIPTIQISPAARDLNSLEESLDDLPNQDSDHSANKSVSLGMDFLRVPQVDTTINIARPCYEDNLNVSRVVDNSNDEDIEVICRYSSTPVRSPSKNARNVNDTDVSMLSISSASPIAPAEISTAPRSNNHSSSSNQNIAEDGKVYLNLDHQKCNVLCSEPQIIPQQTQVREPCRAPALSHMSQTSFGDNGGGQEKTPYSCHDAMPSASYAACHSSGYYPCLQSGADYNEYHLSRGGSWPDVGYRADLSPGTAPIPSMTDPCCFSFNGGMAGAGGCMGGVSQDTEYFVYPSIYVSSAGLISVLLRNDISVEMTVDRTIRVVSHNHMMAVATDSRGTAACLYHPAVKVFQMGNTTDIATTNFRAQMGGNDCIVFSNGVNYFRLEGAELQPTAPMKFIDILRDQSVNLLFSSEGYGETLVASCMQVAAQAEYANLPKGGVIVRINGVKVTQTGGGDVTVVTGAKFIRLSPNSGTTRLGNRFVDIEVEKDWTVKLTRGSHSFVYAKKRAMVCNGKMEAGFDENNGLKVNNLAPRHPLLADPTMVRRPARKPVRPVTIPGPGVCCTPKRRATPPTSFGGRWGAGGVGSI